MGNTVPPRMCREAGTAVVGRQRPRNTMTEASNAAPAPAPRRVSVAARRQPPPDDVEEEKEATRAGRRRCGGVPRAVGGEAATVVTVKLVLKRRDAEELVARLNAQSARERKARMAELNYELRKADGGGCGAGASASPASCRDAWRPRFAPIHENNYL